MRSEEIERSQGYHGMKVLKRILLIAGVLVAFVLGYGVKSLVAPGNGDEVETTGSTEGQPLEWTCSMHPEIRRSEPGPCPICGMDLIPVKSEVGRGGGSASAQSNAAKDKKYACAMFCLPPLPHPGDCPICGMEMVEVDQYEGDAAHDQDAGPTLTLTPAARKLAQIETMPVRKQFVEADIRMVGKIDYDETRLKSIASRVPGRIDRLYVDYTGIPVSEGDHLVYLYSPELMIAQAELIRAIETAVQLESSGSETVRQNARGLIEDARKKLRLWGLADVQISEIEERGEPSDHMTIYSPIGGIVVDKNATEGMYVDTGTRIYTIADLSRLWVRLDAYESDLAWLRYGQEVEFETEAYPGELFTGTVAFIDPILDGQTRTVKVRVNVSNEDGRLKPQMFVRAVARARIARDGLVVNDSLAGKWISPMHPEIVKDHPGSCDVCGMPLVRAEILGFVSPETKNAEPPLVIPASAPLITGKRAVVYVELPSAPGTFQGREIVLGPRAGDYYLVRGGLVEGERVVTQGNFKLDSAIQIQAKPSMMNPEDDQSRIPGEADDLHDNPESHVHGDEQKIEEDPGSSAELTDQVSPATRSAVGPAFDRAQLEPVYQAYFAVQKALSRDDLNLAQSEAGSLGRKLDHLDTESLDDISRAAWHKERADMRESVKRLEGATDLENARQAFALLSESMIAMVQAHGSTATVYRLHCPMAFSNRGAAWLQDQKPTANPYFGAVMFKCGVVKETIEPVEIKK